MRSLHAVLPNDIDDPSAPSGGNRYDRQILDGLAALGWSVREHAVSGSWPQPGGSERTQLGRLLATLPDNSLVLLDGLIASAVPAVLAPQARRLQLVVLVHMALGDADTWLRRHEREALSTAAAVVTTSAWSRERLLDLYALPPDRVHVASPGADCAALASGSGTGTQLLCVAAVTRHKGHDVLVDALATVSDGQWTCVCVGTLDREPGFVDRVRQQAQAYEIADRVSLVGARTGAELESRYAAADLLVLASRGETYGMVVTEALARGIPVLATAANGLPEALGHAPDGSLPGLLVPPDDAASLGGALRRWLGEPELRRQLKSSACGRRSTLTGWAHTSELIAAVLTRTLADMSVTR